MVSMPGFEPRAHWWEVSTLTTVPSLALPYHLRLFIKLICLALFISLSLSRAPTLQLWMCVKFDIDLPVLYTGMGGRVDSLHD